MNIPLPPRHKSELHWFQSRRVARAVAALRPVHLPGPGCADALRSRVGRIRAAPDGNRLAAERARPGRPGGAPLRSRWAEDNCARIVELGNPQTSALPRI